MLECTQRGKKIKKEGGDSMNNKGFCLNCGKAFDIHNFYKSCDECYHKYKAGRKYHHCLKCGEEKPYDERGLCRKCYFQALYRNKKLDNFWFN